MKKRIVITGASGHIGYHVVKQLLKSGYPVLLLARKENKNITSLKDLGADIAFVDFDNANSYKHLLNNADVLFHLASENTIDVSDEERVIHNTFGLTKAVIDTAVSQHIQTIIYTSSVVVLGRSSNAAVLINEHSKTSYAESPYVKGKLLAEEYCDKLIQQGKADIRRIYPSWVIGSNDEKITPPHKIIRDYLQKGQWFYFKGGISIAGVHEVAKAHIDAWFRGRPNEKYITAGNNITFRQLYDALAACSGRNKPFILVPKWLMLSIAVIAKAMGIKSIPDPAYIKSIIGNYSWYNSGKAVSEIGYTIPELDLLLGKTVADLKNN